MKYTLCHLRFYFNGCLRILNPCQSMHRINLLVAFIYVCFMVLLMWSKTKFSNSEKVTQEMNTEFSDKKLEQLEFFRRKESEYQLRRNIINNYCQNEENLLNPKQIAKMSTVDNKNMAINLLDNISYCNIAKAASTTWTMHFIKMADIGNSKLKKLTFAPQELFNELWGPSKYLPEREVVMFMVLHYYGQSRLNFYYLLDQGIQSNSEFDHPSESALASCICVLSKNHRLGSNFMERWHNHSLN